MAQTVILDATGVTKIATAGQNTGPGGWYVIITANTNSNGTAWNGSIVLKQDLNAPGSVSQPIASGSLTNVAYYDSNGAAVSAGTALTTTATVTVDATGYDLYAALTLTTAATTVTVTVIPASQLVAEPVEGPITPAGNVSRGTFGANLPDTGNYAFPGTVSATTGTFTTVGGTLSTAAQPNVTSVGTLSALTVTAAITGSAATNTTQGNGLRAYLADGMLAIGTITVSGGDATKFKTTTTAIYTISGAAYAKAATDTLAFSTAGTINTAGAAGTAHWGAWLVQIDSAGTITTKAVGGGTTDQDYATEALAIAALPAVTAANCQLGYITVQGLASTAWVATTSNLTVGGGAGNCTARNFYDLPAAKTLPAAI